MLFNSFIFVAFFLITYGMYALLRTKTQNRLLLAASYVFYGWWDVRFLSLIFLSTLIDYVCGLRIHETPDQRRRRFYLALSLCSNLGILLFFKYFGFFMESLADLIGLWGLHADPRFLQIVLPVGISFYTFQTMSYTIDIYRNKMEPTRDFLNFALFVAYFPQLVAGPIERAAELLPQIEGRRILRYRHLREGAWLILFGYVKKVVLADNLAVFVNEVYNAPESAFGCSIPIATLAFALQIYGDFSGYSNIARGISKLMGIELMQNFRRPYFSINPSEFWNRWHISLSTWLRDYLYIPLGGNRHGSGKTYRNLLITMLLGGLWHGAAWNFVLWGAFHGLILILYRRFPGLGRSPSRFGHAVRLVVFFAVTLLGWMIFRVNALSDIPLLLSKAVTPFAFTGKLALLTILLFGLPVLLLDLAQERKQNEFVVKTWPRPIRFAVYMALISLICLSGVMNKNAFIYFQF